MPSGIDMTPLDELAKLISEKGRKILGAQNPADLRTLQGANSVFILQLPEGSSAAGGRAGGFGERRLSKLYCSHYAERAWRELYEVERNEKLEKYDLPYHAAGTP